NFIAGMERELLPDGTHFHRAFGYHCGFIGNPVAMIHLGRRIDPGMEFPERFYSLTQLATQSLVSVLTPTFTTPGINDDFTADIAEKRDLLHLASEAFERDDWRYLVSEGRAGTRPEALSVLLPDAQLVAMRSVWSSDAHYLLFNVSPDGGHHHPDTLSIQIYAAGTRLLTEPGCGHYYTGERELSKRSWWHNCPTLGERMLPNSPAPQVLHWETGGELDYAVGQISLECEGGEAIFRRHVYFIHRRYWILFDEFDLPDGEVVWENFHFPIRHLTIPQDGLSLEVKDEQGPGLTMVVGQTRWKVESEQANRWLMYGDPPQSTTVLHYEADAETARKGFAALFVPSSGSEDVVEAGVEEIETREDGSTAITAIVNGGRHKVVTWAAVASG
ncbi:MAG: heparinase II/III family protein, partial [Candidatus Latescibacteria bacterium]|nr:heparinase II/III family protein [Candidatus Latescibacterota bacterium]